MQSMNALSEEDVYRLAGKIVSSSLDAIITVDSNGCVVGWNSAAAKMFQYAETDMLGKAVSVIIPHRMRFAHTAGMRSYNETGASKLTGNIVELSGLRRDLTEFPMEMSIFHLMNGRRRFFTAIVRDISERKRLETLLIEREREMRRLATTDALTGLENRRSALEKLKIEMKHSADNNKCLSIMMLDIDFFKKVNDTHGHGAGDDVLQHVSELLRSTSREQDTCSRLGGEEFLLILPDCDGTYAVMLANKIRLRLAEHPIATRIADIPVTCSIGAAQWVGEPLEMFIGRADAALYSAKRHGRNRVVNEDAMTMPGNFTALLT